MTKPMQNFTCAFEGPTDWRFVHTSGGEVVVKKSDFSYVTHNIPNCHADRLIDMIKEPVIQPVQIKNVLEPDVEEIFTLENLPVGWNPKDLERFNTWLYQAQPVKDIYNALVRKIQADPAFSQEVLKDLHQTGSLILEIVS